MPWSLLKEIHFVHITTINWRTLDHNTTVCLLAQGKLYIFLITLTYHIVKNKKYSLIINLVKQTQFTLLSWSLFYKYGKHKLNIDTTSFTAIYIFPSNYQTVQTLTSYRNAWFWSETQWALLLPTSNLLFWFGNCFRGNQMYLACIYQRRIIIFTTEIGKVHFLYS